MDKFASACCVCHRSEFGSRVPKTKQAAKNPLVIKIGERFTSMVHDEDRMSTRWEVCIDCRPIIEPRITAAIEAAIKGEGDE